NARTADDGEGRWVDRGLHPAGLTYFVDTVSPGAEIRETIVAVGIGHGAQVSRAVDSVQDDRPARQSRVARVVYAVAVAVLKLLARDTTQLKVAEVHSRDRGAAGHRDIPGIDRGLYPAEPGFLANPVGPWVEVRKAVVAAGVSDRAPMSGA